MSATAANLPQDVRWDSFAPVVASPRRGGWLSYTPPDSENRPSRVPGSTQHTQASACNGYNLAVTLCYKGQKKKKIINKNER